jgi:hypothetical protein
LAQAGYEGDPRLRGAARRILERVVAYLRSPLAQKPFVRVGNQHVLAAEAAPPSIHLLFMLAYMPLFRTEHHDAMEAIYQHLSQPLPRQEGLQLVGKKPTAQPQLVLGDMLPNRNAADDDVALAITCLELLSRLGYLRRNENWSRLYERFLCDRDEHGAGIRTKACRAAQLELTLAALSARRSSRRRRALDRRDFRLRPDRPARWERRARVTRPLSPAEIFLAGHENMPFVL